MKTSKIYKCINNNSNQVNDQMNVTNEKKFCLAQSSPNKMEKTNLTKSAKSTQR